MLKKSPYEIPVPRQIRVIIDTDTGCEADDHFAIAQALMTPKFDVVGICAEHFTNQYVPDSKRESYDEIVKIVGLMGLENQVRICRGSDPLEDLNRFEKSEASELIVAEAMKDDPRPLYILLIGAVTNVAVAFLTEPAIKDKVLLVGGSYPTGSWNFNLCNDYLAYNVLLDSGAEWWTTSLNEGLGFKASLMKLYNEIYPCGEIGKYLFERVQYASFELTRRIDKDIADGRMGHSISKAAQASFMPCGEFWAFGDCAVVGLAMFDHMDAYRMLPAPLLADPSGRIIERPDNTYKLRCYDELDSQLIMDDLFAKFKYHFG